MYVETEAQDWRLVPMGVAKPGETCTLMGTGPGLAHQESAAPDFGQVWNWTDLLSQSKPGPLAGYRDPLITLLLGNLNTGKFNVIMKPFVFGPFQFQASFL